LFRLSGDQEIRLQDIRNQDIRIIGKRWGKPPPYAWILDAGCSMLDKRMTEDGRQRREDGAQIKTADTRLRGHKFHRLGVVWRLFD